MNLLRTLSALVVCFLAAILATNALAQNTGPNLPRPDFKFKGKVGKTYKDSDPPQFPQPVQAPKGAPNVVLILLDDTGFGQYSAFGGGVPSPTLDKLAAEGLRYNRFHTTALCSPTRAALITGCNHHSAATGVITEAATGYDGYTCVLPRGCGTIGETAWRDLDSWRQRKALASVVKEVRFDPYGGTVSITLADDALKQLRRE